MAVVMEEVWKPIPTWEGLYEISNYGRVRSVDKIVKVRWKGIKETTKSVKGKILTPQLDKDGYAVIHMRDTFHGRNRLLKVHRLVAEVYIPNPNKYMHIDHINGIRNDNRAENLRWCTNNQNANFELARKNKSVAVKQSYINHPELRALRAQTLGKCGCIPVDVWYDDKYVGRFESTTEFCRQYSLNPSYMLSNIKKRGSYKGYTLKRVKKDA